MRWKSNANEELDKNLAKSKIIREYPREEAKNCFENLPTNRLSMSDSNEKVPPTTKDDEDDSSESEDLYVFETQEDEKILRQVMLSKLARMGFHRPLGSPITSIFIILAFLISYDSFNAFTVGMGQYGFGFFIGFPLLYMELALGQYIGTGPVNVFTYMAPAFIGLGLAMMALNMLVSVTDQVIVTYFLKMLIDTLGIFGDEMPWHNCHSNYNSRGCREFFHTCAEYQERFNRTPPELIESLGLKYSSFGSFCYLSQIQIDKELDWQLTNISEGGISRWFASEALGQHLFRHVHISEGSFEYFQWPSNETITYFLAAWTFVLLATLAGRNVMAFVSRLAIIFTFCAITTLGITLFILADYQFPYLHGTEVFHEGFDERKESLFIYYWRVFVFAVFTNLTTLRLGQGGLIYLGSQKNFHNNLAIQSLIIFVTANVFNFFYSLMHLFAVDSYVLHLLGGDINKWKTIGFEAVEGRDFYLNANSILKMIFFMQALRLLKSHEPVMVMLLSAAGVLITVASKVVRVLVLVGTLVDWYPDFEHSAGRNIAIHLAVALCAIFSFLFFYPNGFELQIGIDNLTTPTVAMTICFMELIAVGWFYGGMRFMANLMAMSRITLSGDSRTLQMVIRGIVIILWMYVIPLLLLIAIVGKFYFGFTANMNSITDLNVILAICIVSLIPGFAIYKAAKIMEKTKNFYAAFSPDYDHWGPRRLNERELAAKAELMLRTR